MQNLYKLFLTLLTITVIALPGFADARAGGGRSVGSMGSRTYSPSNGAVPIERSTAVPPSNPGMAQPGMTAPGFGGGGFWQGMAGGFLGAGLAGMLFGHYGMGGGFGGGGMGLLPLILIGGVIYYLMRKLGRGGFSSMGSNYSYPAPAAQIAAPLNITDQDKMAFEQSLMEIQQAWSDGNLNKLRQLVTPEMLQYFSEELSNNASRGLVNKVEQVRLETANITQSWSEYGLDYATASMQWTALDYMVSLNDPSQIVSGDKNQPSSAQEIWTFVRSAGGHWLLSAIQQTA